VEVRLQPWPSSLIGVEYESCRDPQDEGGIHGSKFNLKHWIGRLVMVIPDPKEGSHCQVLFLPSFDSKLDHV